MLKYLVSFSILLAFYQNCSSNDVKFNQSESSQEEKDRENLGRPGEETNDLEIIANICEKASLIEKTIEVNIPATNKTCEWGRNGNLSERNGYFQARIEQRVPLNLPSNAILCEAKFTFEKQNFLYDDHFLILLNKTVLTSSYDFSNSLSSDSFGLLKYNWSNIKGINWNEARHTQYCPEVGTQSSQCSFPETDQDGAIRLKYDNKLIQSIMASDKVTQHSLTMVSIGDNDDLDCEQSGLKFDLKLTYAK